MAFHSKWILVGCSVCCVVSSSLAASKSYKHPATVPAIRLLSATRPSLVMEIPSDAEITRATKLVRQTLSEDYQAGATTLRRKAAARDLLEQGINTRDDAAARYVLLTDAAEMAAGVGDASTASRAVDQLGMTFQIDPLAMKAMALSDAGKAAFTKEAIDGLEGCCMLAEQAAAVDERYDLAGRFLDTADLAADRGRRVDLKTTVIDRKKELDALRAGQDEYAKAKQVLSKTPGDPGASLTAGRFMCFVKGDWEHGLPLLAASGDESLHGLAVKDMENPNDAGAQVMAGNGWWDVSTKLTGVTKEQVRSRALYWYHQAMPGLTGVNRRVVEERLKEVQQDRMRQMNLVPGLVAELFNGMNCQRLRLTRIDPLVDFDFGDKPAGEGVAKDNFSILWDGELNVAQAGVYTFVLIVNDGAALSIDGQTLLNKDGMSHKRNGERVTVRLDEGLHLFKLRFWDGGGTAKMRVLWIPPGSGTEETVPAEAFCHESDAPAAIEASAQLGSMRR